MVLPNTQYYNLFVTNDQNTTFQNFRTQLVAETNSNMTKIDAALHEKANASDVPSPSDADEIPEMAGDIGSAGESGNFARADHVHPTDTTRALRTKLIEATLRSSSWVTAGSTVIDGRRISDYGNYYMSLSVPEVTATNVRDVGLKAGQIKDVFQSAGYAKISVYSVSTGQIVFVAAGVKPNVDIDIVVRYEIHVQSGGIDTSDATATDIDVVYGETYYGADGTLRTGSRPNTITAIASDLRSGKQIVDSSGNVIYGSVADRDASDVTHEITYTTQYGWTSAVSIPAGIYNTNIQSSIPVSVGGKKIDLTNLPVSLSTRATATGSTASCKYTFTVGNIPGAFSDVLSVGFHATIKYSNGPSLFVLARNGFDVISFIMNSSIGAHTYNSVLGLGVISTPVLTTHNNLNVVTTDVEVPYAILAEAGITDPLTTDVSTSVLIAELVLG